MFSGVYPGQPAGDGASTRPQFAGASMEPTELHPQSPSSTPTTPVDAIRAGDLADIEAVRQALGDEYQILDELGRGGMAVVYRARERQLQREVAVKVLPLSLSFDAQFVERFEQEARIAAQLEHPNIIPIHRVGRQGRVSYFAMKLLRGKSLSAILEQRGRLAPAEIRRLLIEIGGALGYAARLGVVHRDIKPENIVFDEHGHPVLTDFGIAKAPSGAKLTGTGKSIGTPQYMSPEQVRGHDLDGRSDIYSLGIVAYQCLTGHAPFDGDDAYAIGFDQLTTPLPTPELTTADERALFATVQRMTQKQPNERFRDAGELLTALGAETGTGSGSTAASGIGTSAAPATAPATARRGPTPKTEPLSVQGAAKPKRPTSTALGQIGARAPDLWMILAACGTVVWQWLEARSWRFWTAACILAGVAFVTARGAHRRHLERSHCPPNSAFDVLVDPVGMVRQGADLNVHYDVCGLERGTRYDVLVVITKNETAGGLKRLFGASRAIRLSGTEVATGPAIRVGQELGRVKFTPGSYQLDLLVSDVTGRRRAVSQNFGVVAR